MTRVNAKTVSVAATSSPHTIGYDRITGRRRDGTQLDSPHGQPWPVELARKVARWHRLERLLALPSSQPSSPPFGSDPQAANRHRHAGWARRIALGLPTSAREAEVAAFTGTDPATDLATARQLAAACLDIYDRLQAGERPADIAASTTPVGCGEPAWRMPAGEGQDRRVDQIQPGDLIKGCWTRTGDQRRLLTDFAGPVVTVSPTIDRYERGRWVTLHLLDGTQRSYQTHVWFRRVPRSISHGAPRMSAVPTAQSIAVRAPVSPGTRNSKNGSEGEKHERSISLRPPAGEDVAVRIWMSPQQIAGGEVSTLPMPSASFWAPVNTTTSASSILP